MSITPLPTPPSRNDDPDTFVTRSDAFIGALPVFVTETNELASNIETDAETINTAIETAEGHATSAGESAAAASDSADAAALSEDNAEIFAAAAQAAIGAPSLAGNAFLPLRVNAAEDGVEFADLIQPAYAYAEKTDTATTTSSNFADTGLSVTITLNNPNSKVLLLASISASGGNSSSVHTFFKMQRGSTDLILGDAASDREPTQFNVGAGGNSILTSGFGMALDEPGTQGPHTYKIQWRTSNATSYLNRSYVDNDFNNQSRSVSTFTALEIPQ